MKKQLLGLASLLLLVVCSTAQDVPKAEVYVGYTFVRFNANAPVNAFTANGGVGSFQYNFNKYFSFVGELGGVHNGALTIGGSGVRQPDQTSFTYLFGPRVFFNKAGVVSPFFEYLVGGFHNSRSFSVPNSLIPPGVPPPPGVTVQPGPVDTKFRSTQNAAAMAVGGGVDLRLSHLISFRPVQLDYMPTNFSRFNIPGLGTINNGHWQQNLRYSTGINFRMGGATPPPPKAACTVAPAEVLPWEGPVTASLQTSDFNPKHTLSYAWSSTSGAVTGQGTSATLDTTSLVPGEYTVRANASDPKEKKMNSASCTASFTVKQPRAPVVGCSASPSTVHPGDPVTISVQGSSPDVSRIQDRKFSTSAGAVKDSQTRAGSQPGQFSTVATLDTTGVQPGPISVTVGITDVHGLSGSCVATANVEALPLPPVEVIKESLVSDCQFKNQKKLARIDNECKATLDDVALRLQQQPNGKLVVVGYAEEEEEVAVTDVESLRAFNAKTYLTGGEAKQQIDSNRIEVRKGAARDQGSKAVFYFVPEGGTFTVQQTSIVDESSLPADKTGAPKKQKASKQEQPAPSPSSE